MSSPRTHDLDGSGRANDYEQMFFRCSSNNGIETTEEIKPRLYRPTPGRLRSMPIFHIAEQWYSHLARRTATERPGDQSGPGSHSQVLEFEYVDCACPPVPRKPLRAATIVREAQSRRQDVGDILISEAWPFLSNAGSRGVRKPQSLGARRSLRCDSASTGAKDGFPLGERQRIESPVIYQGNFTVLTKLKYGLATLPFSSCPDTLFRDLPTAVSLFP
jgi:hypothetical protein